MSLNEHGHETANLTDRINDSIRENPLAAGLIGAGLVWMLFGAKGIGAVGTLVQGAATAAHRTGSTAAGAAVKAASETSEVVSNAGSAAVQAVQEASSDLVSGAASLVPDLSLAETARKVADTVASSGSDYGAAVKSQLSEKLEQQPLLIGAIGLAVGAGIASAFAATPIESKWMGTKGAAVRQALGDVIDEAKEQGSQIVSDLKDEATRQGLNMEGVGAIATKISKVANAAQDSMSGRANGSSREH